MASNEELALSAKCDSEAFGKLYDLYYDKLLMYVFRRVLDVNEAEDILSNTFFKALNKIDSFNPQRASFSTWIYRIATNEVNMYFRKRGKYIINLDPEMLEFFAEKNNFNQVEKIDSVLSQHQDFQIVAKAIRRLKPIYQDILHLRYFEDMSHREIAEAVKIRESSVRVYLLRALKKLHDQMNGDARKFLNQEYV